MNASLAAIISEVFCWSKPAEKNAQYVHYNIVCLALEKQQSIKHILARLQDYYKTIPHEFSFE